MFKEVLQIVPKLSSGDLNNMEKTLGQRFGNVAKKFGKGLMATLAGGGILGAGVSFIDKLLNPLKEIQDSIDSTLKKSDDLVTNAKQFGTSAGKLFRLQQIAKSTGVDEGNLNILLEKFQASIAEAAADPNKQTSVRKFVGEKDIAAAFFEFIQALQKLSKNDQIRVQQEIFGEKKILTMSELLQTDLAKQSKLVGGPTSAQLTPGLEKLAGLSDLQDALEARRTLNDTFRKSQLINKDIILSKDKQEKQALDKQNKEIQSYDNLAAIQIAANEINAIVKDGILKLTGIIVQVTNLTENIKKITSSAIFRGIFGTKDK